MAERNIRPEKITKPIQLLAAWLSGLVILNGSFLTAASYLSEPSWAAGLLVIAVVVNVPLFLIALFMLQTKFRPEMQEDTFYSKYLENKFANSSSSVKPLDIQDYSSGLAEHIIKVLGPSVAGSRAPIEQAIQTSKTLELSLIAKKLRTLAELFIRPSLWPALVHKWENNSEFQAELVVLRNNGLANFTPSNPGDAELTELGKQVATVLQEQGQLFNQNNVNHWERQEKKLSKLLGEL